MSTNNVSPQTFLGGKWSRIGGGHFLMAAGDGYTAGSEGGSNSVTLKEANLPNMYGYLADYEQWLGLGQFTNADPSMIGGYLGKGEMEYYGSGGRGWSVAYGNEAYPAGVSKGSGQSFDNRPAYTTVWMWIRQPD